jgi:alpha-mannosidase
VLDGEGDELVDNISKRKDDDGDGIYVVAYNALAQKRSEVLKVPVSSDAIDYEVTQLETSNAVEFVVIPNPNFASKKNAAPFHLYFEAADLAPLSATTFLIQMSTSKAKSDNNKQPSNTLTKVDKLETGSVIKDAMKHVSINIGYYTSYAQEIGQASGAYIFRPNETTQELNILADDEGRTADEQISGPDIYTSSLVSEMHTTVSPWVKYVTRIKKGAPYVEVEYTVGPIPVDDGVGKEVVVRYQSRDIINHGIFYTDSNGREFLKRKLSHRPTWDLVEHQPVAGNYYPVNAAIYVEGENYHKSMAVLTDRSQGGSSLINGTIDLMVHRRTIADDKRGVDEAMNETDGGMASYPPYGNRERQGKGLVITGIHRILLSDTTGGAALARSQMDQVFSNVQLFFAKAKKTSASNSANNSNHLKKAAASSPAKLKAALHLNLMLTTFMTVPGPTMEGTMISNVTSTSASSYLVRIGHQYATGEGPLAKTEQVDMKVLFPNYSTHHTISMQEMTLSGNQLRREWEQKRYHWRTSTSDYSDAAATTPTSTACALSDDTTNTTFSISPMKICTFVVTFSNNVATSKEGEGVSSAAALNVK